MIRRIRFPLLPALLLFLATGCAAIPGRHPVDSVRRMVLDGNGAAAEALLDAAMADPETIRGTIARKDWLRSGFLRARLAERNGRDAEALAIYRHCLLRADRWKDESPDRELRYRGLFLFGICRTLAMTGGRAELDIMTRCLVEPGFRSPDHPHLADLSDEERYFLLKNVFSIAQIFFAGDHGRYLSVMNACKDILSRKDTAALRMFRPVHYLTDVLMDEVWVDLFIAYAKLQSGDLGAVHRIQETYERMYENPAVRSLLRGADLLKLYRADRAVLFGFGGYGYALLGRYERAGRFFRDAVSALEPVAPNRWHERVYLGGLKIARADAYLVPRGRDAEAERSLTDGVAILEATRADPWAELASPMGSWSRGWLSGYARIARAKFHFRRERWDAAFRDARSALGSLDRTSPKQLVVDAAFYAYLSGRRMVDPVPLEPILAEAREKLAGFAGFEMWKIHYLESLHGESAGDMDGALAAIRAAAETVETFRKERFPDLIQQVTFMEDKGLPYQRWIRLLLKSRLPETERARRIFEVVETQKRHALELASPKESADRLGSLQATLSPDAALIQLYYGDDFLLRISVTREAIGLRRDAISAEDIHTRVAEFRKTLSPRHPEFSARKAAATGHALYRMLLAPLEASGQLDGKTKLYIVPHRDLHYVAWNALSLAPSLSGGRFVFDRWRVTVLPAATAGLGELRDDGRISGSDRGTTVLIGPDIPSDILVPEMAGIPGIRLLADEAASVPATLRELETVRHLLILAHGRFDRSSPMESAIALNGPNGADFFTLAHLRDASISCDFVSLTGCATGTVQRYSEMDPSRRMERFPESSDLLGLYRSLIARGVGHVSVSIVQELDQHLSERFLVRLARELVGGRNVPVAFHRAVAEIKNANPLDPYFWGGYLLVGRNASCVDCEY